MIINIKNFFILGMLFYSIFSNEKDKFFSSEKSCFERKNSVNEKYVDSCLQYLNRICSDSDFDIKTIFNKASYVIISVTQMLFISNNNENKILSKDVSFEEKYRYFSQLYAATMLTVLSSIIVKSRLITIFSLVSSFKLVNNEF